MFLFTIDEIGSDADFVENLFAGRANIDRKESVKI